MCIRDRSQGTPPIPASPSYPDTTAGLVQCVTDILASVTSDPERARGLTRSLILPDHERWLARVFPPAIAARATVEYGKELAEPGKFQSGLESMFEKLVKEQRTKVAAVRLTSPGREATGLQNTALEAMVQPVALYTVKVGKESPSGGSIWSFVHVDGSFRFLGKLRETLSSSASAPADGTAAFRKFAESLAQGKADASKLALPGHEAWFKAQFEPATAEALAKEYQALREQIGDALPAAITRNVRDGKTEVSVQSFTRAIDPKANGLINAALQRMKVPAPLFLLRLTRPGERDGTSYWSFVQEGGEFRFLGKMAALRKGGKATSGDMVGDLLCSLPLADAERILQEKKLLTGSAVEYLKQEGLLK